ncbi:DUF3017 domain-containing protein [Nocardioides pantholopis]|uniref:DUF3017 domain-containing protein n=1 Tax=Nocardioides pantholopis TaxID=2483798 RepID=UPI0019D2B402|nr:DUF3017 domain-containing protein [Nocardioides pantholopis]
MDPAPETPGEPVAVPSEEEVAAELEQARAEADARRRYPSTIGGMFYILIMVLAAIGLAVAATGNWRAGVRWIAVALEAGALLRLVLPARDAGMLAVRHRIFDVLALALVGGVLFFLAQTIPDQPV